MSEILLQPRLVSQHWTVPVSREEMLAVREKFRRVGWVPLRHMTRPHQDQDERLGLEGPGGAEGAVMGSLARCYRTSPS